MVVEDFVKQCFVCQQAKHTNHSPPGLLQPLPIPEGVWMDISMDFIEGLPKSNGYSVIMVVVDRLTKFAHFVAVKHPYTASTIAQLFMDNIVKLHGLPNSIVSDRDIIFVSAFWKELFKLYIVNLQLSTAYHPQSDGQTERVNQCLELYLRYAVQDSPKTWHSWLSLAQLWYNSTYHSSRLSIQGSIWLWSKGWCCSYYTTNNTSHCSWTGREQRTPFADPQGEFGQGT